MRISCILSAGCEYAAAVASDAWRPGRQSVARAPTDDVDAGGRHVC